MMWAFVQFYRTLHVVFSSYTGMMFFCLYEIFIVVEYWLTWDILEGSDCCILFVHSSLLGLGLGKKPGSEKPNRTRSEKVVSNPNRNWLNIRMGSKFWYLENRNRTRSEPKYFGYPIISEIDLYTYIY